MGDLATLQFSPREGHVELPEPEVLRPVLRHGPLYPGPVRGGGHEGHGGEEEAHGQVEDEGVLAEEVDGAEAEDAGRAGKSGCMDGEQRHLCS